MKKKETNAGDISEEIPGRVLERIPGELNEGFVGRIPKGISKGSSAELLVETHKNAGVIP